MEGRAWGSQEGKESAHLRACSCQEVGCMSWADDLCWCNQQATESDPLGMITSGQVPGRAHFITESSGAGEVSLVLVQGT